MLTRAQEVVAFKKGGVPPRRVPALSFDVAIKVAFKIGMVCLWESIFRVVVVEMRSMLLGRVRSVFRLLWCVLVLGEVGVDGACVGVLD